MGQGRILALPLFFGEPMATAFIVAGLGFGDEGKGTITDYLTAKHNAYLVVRYNGGSQAAHNVVTNNGVHHTFSQFGSGLFQGAKTYLSKFMFFEPFAALQEAYAIRKLGLGLNGLSTLYVDKDCPVTTPYHRAANRIHETVRGDARHGSCGLGIGETAKDLEKGLALYAGTMYRIKTVEAILKVIQDKKISEMPPDWETKADPKDREMLLSSPTKWAEEYNKIFNEFRWADLGWLADELRRGNSVFEGAQGVLLDEKHGFAPYNTWSTTTFANALELLKAANFPGVVEKVGVIRSYMTRHGAGPFVTELKENRVFEHHTRQNPDLEVPKVEHNETGPWQGDFRVGHLDLPALKYALEVSKGADYLAVTHMDCKPRFVCYDYVYGRRPYGYAHRGMEEVTKLLFECEPMLEGVPVTTSGWTDYVGRYLSTPIRILSHGPAVKHKKER